MPTGNITAGIKKSAASVFKQLKIPVRISSSKTGKTTIPLCGVRKLLKQREN